MSKIKELVNSVVDQEGFNVTDMFYENAEYALEECNGKMPEGLKLEKIESEGGCEGGGDHAEFTLEVSQDDTVLGTVTFHGWYASYDGVYFEDGYFVSKPVGRVIVEYKRA